MERLTKRNSMGMAVYTHEYMCDRCYEVIWRLPDVTGEGSPTDRLCEYEDKQEQGLLIELPCKIGSTLYQPIGKYIHEYKVIGLCLDIHRNTWLYEVAYQHCDDWMKTVCELNVIGKTVFLTRSEAEKALAKMGE